MKLKTDLNLPAPDDFYEALIAMHRDLSDQQSQFVNARLILLLANHIGDPEALAEAMEKARAGIAEVAADNSTSTERKP